MDEKDMTLEQVEAELKALGIEIPACAGKYIGMAATAYAARDQANAACAAMKEIVAEWTDWKPGRGIVAPIQPRHGNCCCCQICGQFHDDCVCQHNKIEEVMSAADSGQPLLDRMAKLERAIGAIANGELDVDLADDGSNPGKWEYLMTGQNWYGPFDSEVEAVLAGVAELEKESHNGE